DERQQRYGRVERRLEGTQIPVVDSYKRCLELQGAVELGLVVNLDQYRHLQLVRRRLQFKHLAWGESRDDEEYAVRAESPGLEHLVRIDREILAQGRQPGRSARACEIRAFSLE